MSIQVYDVKTNDYSLFYYGSYTVSKIKSLFTYSIGGRFEAQKIINGLYLGNINSVYDIEKLKSVGITHVISVIGGFIPPYPEDFNYLVINALDTSNTDLFENFEATNDFIDDAMMENSNILIHCQAGRSRSVTILAAYIIKTFGLDVKTTIDIIKNKRNIIEPNKYFINQLEQYYNSLRYKNLN